MNTRETTQAYRLSQWTDLVKQCRTSGQPVRAWCNENGINEKTYYYWQKKVRIAVSPFVQNSMTSQFVPIEVKTVSDMPTEHQLPAFNGSPKPTIILSSDLFTVSILNDASEPLIESMLRAIKNVR